MCGRGLNLAAIDDDIPLEASARSCHQIIEEFILSSRTAPSLAALKEPRLLLRNDFHPFHTWVTNIFVQRDQSKWLNNALLGTNRQLRAETQAVAHRMNRASYTLDVVFVKNVGLMPTWLSFPLWRKHIDTLRVNFRIFDNIGDVDEAFPWFDKEMKWEGDERTSGYLNIMVLLSCYILNLLEDPVQDGTGVEVLTSPEDRDYEFEYFEYRTIAPYTIKNILIDITGPGPETCYEKARVDPRNVNHCKFGDDMFDRDDLWPLHLLRPEGKPELAHYLASEIFGTLDMMKTPDPLAGYAKMWYQNMGDFEIRVNGQDWDKVDGPYASCTSHYMRSLFCSEEGHAYPEGFDEAREIVERRRQGDF